MSKFWNAWPGDGAPAGPRPLGFPSRLNFQPLHLVRQVASRHPQPAGGLGVARHRAPPRGPRPAPWGGRSASWHPPALTRAALRAGDPSRSPAPPRRADASRVYLPLESSAASPCTTGRFATPLAGGRPRRRATPRSPQGASAGPLGRTLRVLPPSALAPVALRAGDPPRSPAPPRRAEASRTSFPPEFSTASPCTTGRFATPPVGGRPRPGLRRPREGRAR